MQSGSQVVYSKYAGTEVEFNGANHLILKEDDIVGILETDEIKDLKPLNDRVLIKVGCLSNLSVSCLIHNQIIAYSIDGCRLLRLRRKLLEVCC